MQELRQRVPAPSQEATPVKKPAAAARPSWWLFGGIVLLVIILSVGGTFLVLRRHSSGSTTDSKTLAALQGVKDAASYPLYYPAKSPSGFTFNENSLSTQAGIVTYSYSYGSSGKLLITEQSRPPIMEQVQQTQTFDTPVGHAYIADLNGHTTGFIVTNKTLVIISNAASSDTSQLQQFMSSFQSVK